MTQFGVLPKTVLIEQETRKIAPIIKGDVRPITTTRTGTLTEQ